MSRRSGSPGQSWGGDAAVSLVKACERSQEADERRGCRRTTRGAADLGVADDKGVLGGLAVGAAAGVLEQRGGKAKPRYGVGVGGAKTARDNDLRVFLVVEIIKL